jgi:hypothetical protein
LIALLNKKNASISNTGCVFYELGQLLQEQKIAKIKNVKKLHNLFYIYIFLIANITTTPSVKAPWTLACFV